MCGFFFIIIIGFQSLFYFLHTIITQDQYIIIIHLFNYYFNRFTYQGHAWNKFTVMSKGYDNFNDFFLFM